MNAEQKAQRQIEFAEANIKAANEVTHDSLAFVAVGTAIAQAILAAVYELRASRVELTNIHDELVSIKQWIAEGQR